MWRLFKLLIFLVLLGVVGLVGFAYIGDMTPVQTRFSHPITLDVD